MSQEIWKSVSELWAERTHMKFNHSKQDEVLLCPTTHYLVSIGRNTR